MDSTLCQEVVISSYQSDDVLNKYIWAVDEKCPLAVFKGGASWRHCLSMIGNDYLIGSILDTDILKVWPLNINDPDGIEMKCPGIVTALDVSSNGRYCVAAIGSNIYLWQVVTGELIRVLPIHHDEVTCIKFSNDGGYFVSGGAFGKVMVWKLSSCLFLEASEELKPVCTWDNCSSKVLDIHVGHFAKMAKIAVISKTFCTVYSCRSGHFVMQFTSKRWLTSVTMDPAELFVFVGTFDGEVIQFQETSGTGNDEEKQARDNCGNVFNLHKLEVTCLSTSVDGQFLLSGSMDGTVKILSLNSQEVIRVFHHAGPVLNAFFSLCPNLFSTSKHKQPSKIIVKPFQLSQQSLDDEKEDWKLNLQSHELQLVDFIAEETLPAIRIDNLSTDILKQRELKKSNTQMYAYAHNFMSKKISAFSTS